MHRLNLISRC